MREQGGVTAAGSGAGAGAFIAYEFTAQTPQLTITLRDTSVNACLKSNQIIRSHFGSS